MTCLVAARIQTGIDMDRFDVDYTIFILVTLLVSLGRLVSVVFGTLKVCLKEYYDFRQWLRGIRRESDQV